ncbi:MAG: Type secretion system domain [Pedosphaera sp.]|nr:Type secretion system domain [Pedosphaera sp.]
MPLIVTPRQFNQRAQFYQQLSQLTAAGIPIISALDMLSRNPPSRTFREPIREMIAQLSRGATVSEALQHLGRWVPSFDIALVQAGEKSGRLDAVFKLLGQHYDERASLLRQIISDLLYPLFVFHFAVFLFPFLNWFKGGMTVTMAALKILAILVPLYGGVLLVIFASQGKHGEKWRALFERLLKFVPLLGTARHYLALARLSAALEALINAGVTIIEAWEMAAAASGSPAILRAVTAWKPQVVGGQLPSEVINAAPRQFPELFANLYFSGETSGQLDESLRRLHTYYQEEGTRKLRQFARGTAKLIYFAVVGYVAYLILSFYTDYFKQVQDVIDFGNKK